MTIENVKQANFSKMCERKTQKTHQDQRAIYVKA